MVFLGALRPVGVSFCRLANHNVKNVLRKDTNQFSDYNRFTTLTRRMASSSSVVDIDISQLQKFQGDPSATIIDVREVAEIQETGKLPRSINIPLGDVPSALEQDPAKFKEKYTISKPSADKPLVFSCRSGKRSLKAAESASSLGYKNVYNYKGGWLDWEEHFPRD